MVALQQPLMALQHTCSIHQQQTLSVPIQAWLMHFSSGRMRLRSCTQCIPQSAASQLCLLLPRCADVSSTIKLQRASHRATCLAHAVLRARRRLITLLPAGSPSWFHLFRNHPAPAGSPLLLLLLLPAGPQRGAGVQVRQPQDCQ
jgi:hypothetical protein